MKKMIKRIQGHKVLAGLSSVLYHITGITAAANILDKDRFELKPCDGTRAEEDLGHKASYYMSLSRIRNAAYTVSDAGTFSVIFVLNGVKLGNLYSGKAVDYWADFYNDTPGAHATRAVKFEAEDRLYSNKPFIDKASTYCLEVHAMVNNRTPELYLLRKRCLLNHIPLFWYNNTKDLVAQDKRKAIDFQPTFVTPHVEPPREYDFRKGSNSLSPWLALYEYQIKPFDKDTGDAAWKQVKKLGDRAKQRYGTLRYSDALQVFEADVHNEKSTRYDSKNRGREALDQVIKILRSNKWDTKQFINHLHEKWYAPQTASFKENLMSIKQQAVITAAYPNTAKRVETADWWGGMSPEHQKEYVAEHPNSKYAKDYKAKQKKDDKNTKPAAKEPVKKSLANRIKGIFHKLPKPEQEFFATGGAKPDSEPRRKIGKAIKNKSTGILQHLKKQKDEWHHGMKAVSKVMRKQSLNGTDKNALKTLGKELMVVVGTVALAGGMGHGLVSAMSHMGEHLLVGSALSAMDHGIVSANFKIQAETEDGEMDEDDTIMTHMIDYVADFAQKGNIPDECWEKGMTDIADLHYEPESEGKKKETASLQVSKNNFIQEMQQVGLNCERQGQNNVLVYGDKSIVERVLRKQGWTLNTKYEEWSKNHSDYLLVVRGDTHAANVEFVFEGEISALRTASI